jgi:multidrug efflux system outer membrane protein
MHRALLLALAAGCSLAPRYERPAAPVAARYPDAPEAAGPAAAELGWRDLLGDARLQRLVALALEQNRDLRVAALNVELAAARHRIQRSELFPTVGARAGVEASGTFDGDEVAARYSVGAGVTAFELDLFGRIRSLKAQALEEYLATEEARRAAQLALVAEVAIQYLEQRALDEELALARRTLEAVTAATELTRRRFDAGQASELDVQTAAAQVQAARAEVARVTRQRALAENALVLLVGQPLPADLPPPQPLDGQPVLAELPAGLPSDLLARRPDVLAAEHTLRGANASIGAARAAFFPTISLTAFGGLASTALSSLFTAGAAGWTFAPQVTQPIFTGGRNEANLDAAHVRKRIEIARYERAIQVAFREVADALAGRAALEEQLEAQLARVEAEQRRYDISELRYRTGIESYLAVLTAQRDLYTAQQGLIDVRLARLANTVTLYKALGGGWRERTAAPR